MPAPTVDEYVYNTATGQYRSTTTGRFVRQADVQTLIQKEIDAGFARIGVLAEKVANGQLSVDQLQSAMTSHLSYAHDMLYGIGRGGIFAMQQSDFERLTTIKEGEYSYLENFMADIANGNLSVGQIQARIKLYNENTYGTFNAGVEAAGIANGHDECRRVLNPAEHCDDCIELAGRGWQPIGTLPLPTKGSACKANCKCTYETRRSGRQRRRTPVLR